MGFRSNLKRGGGLFVGDHVIESVSFTAVAPDAKTAGDWVYLVPVFRADSADKSNSQHLFLGGVDKYNISKDGKTITVETGQVTIGANVPAGLFLDSLIEGGFPESLLPDLAAGEDLNLDAIVGTRIRLRQAVDVKGNETRGKRKYKDAQGNEREADRTNTVVETVLSLPNAKGSGKSVSRTNGSGTSTTDASDAATEAVLRYVTDAGDDGLPAGKIRMKVLTDKTFKSNPLLKTVVIELLEDAAFLSGVDGIEFDKKAKTYSLMA